MSRARRTAFPHTLIADPPSRDFATTSAPNHRSMRSVWSRVGTLSITVVVPSALRPARRTHDLICAEATGVRREVNVSSISSFGEGARGELYLVSHDGVVYRLAS